MRRQRSREADGRSAEVQAKLIPRLGSRIAEELLADGSMKFFGLETSSFAGAMCGPKREE